MTSVRKERRGNKSIQSIRLKPCSCTGSSENYTTGCNDSYATERLIDKETDKKKNVRQHVMKPPAESSELLSSDTVKKKKWG